MTLLEALSAPGQAALWQGVMVFLRVGAAMAFLPAFGERMVPARVRLAAALAFTAVVAPAVPAVPAAWGPAGAEVAAGLVLGAFLRLVVMALQVAGTIAAQSASLSQLFGGAGPEPQPAMANLLLLAGLALALAAGLHVRLAQFLILSYGLIPAGTLPAPGAVAEAGVARVARAFALGFALAIPFVVGATLYNVALGFINRAMPQLMVAFVGAPALTLGGLALLAAAAPVLLPVWLSALEAALEGPLAP